MHTHIRLKVTLARIVTSGRSSHLVTTPAQPLVIGRVTAQTCISISIGIAEVTSSPETSRTS
jgi:hypothetical protein